MLITGLVRSSLIDYPGKVAAIVFTQGCNFRCGFCHNPDMIDLKPKDQGLVYKEDDIFDFLKTRVGKLDGLVITGGEPLIQPDVINFIKKVKELGFLVKLDTNGANPLVLKKIIENQLVDYIAMDLKSPLQDYKKITGYSDVSKIQESITAIMSSEIDYEFRTTVLPLYHNMDSFKEMASLIKDAKKYTIQGFRSGITYDKSLQTEGSFTLKELDEIAGIFRSYVQDVVVHDNIA